MKVQPNYTRHYSGVNQNNNPKQGKQNPTFGNLGAPLVAFASFIEKNGFLGEFLTVDTVGMMGPRTIQGYTRNQDELGHLNYKAGREELVREILSGPAYFFVPLGVLGAAGLTAGSCAKVSNTVLEKFKTVMAGTNANIKESKEISKNFIEKLSEKAFEGYTKETHFADEIKDILNKTVKGELAPKKAGQDAVEILTKFNKANGKFLDNASHIKLDGKEFDIATICKDAKNYLKHFTKKAATSTEARETFIESFHNKAKNLRNITNILAVSALSIFLLIIPKLYQTSKKFPGKDGLVTDKNPANNKAPAPETKSTEAVNENK